MMCLTMTTVGTVVDCLADAIPMNYIAIAQQYQIPASILYAVALTESGKSIPSGRFRPWPWTLNVAGMPKRYATRKQAWNAIHTYLNQGIRSIDIGLLQINWRWHKDKLKTPWQALDPMFNAKTGAKLLQQAYQRTGNWQDAVGYYHSPGQKPAQKKRAKQYALRVLTQLKKRVFNPHSMPSQS